MQPIHISNGQNQNAVSIPKRASDTIKKSVKTDAKVAFKLPDDIVNLSMSSADTQRKKPSTPVSNAEKEALLQDFSGQQSISIYA